MSGFWSDAYVQITFAKFSAAAMNPSCYCALKYSSILSTALVQP
jgi:hypothetical protein